VERSVFLREHPEFPSSELEGCLRLNGDVSELCPYLYHAEDGVGEPLMSQAKASLPPTRAAEPMRRRPNVGDALGDALQARTTCDLPLLCPAQRKW
jgi:hypothetical protein